MKLLIIRSLGRGWPEWKEGDTVEADQATASRLVAANLATVVAEDPIEAVPPAPIAAVPAEPTIVTKTRTGTKDKEKRGDQ